MERHRACRRTAAPVDPHDRPEGHWLLHHPLPNCWVKPDRKSTNWGAQKGTDAPHDGGARSRGPYCAGVVRVPARGDSLVRPLWSRGSDAEIRRVGPRNHAELRNQPAKCIALDTSTGWRSKMTRSRYSNTMSALSTTSTRAPTETGSRSHSRKGDANASRHSNLAPAPACDTSRGRIRDCAAVLFGTRDL